MTTYKKMLLFVLTMLLSLTLSANPFASNQENIQLNLQIYIQNQTFPQDYLNSFRSNIYLPSVVSAFYRTSSIDEEAEFAPISRVNNYYTDAGKLLSTDNYNQHVGGQLVLYSRRIYQYEDNQLTTVTLESYEEFEVLMSTSVQTYYYDDNNLIDYITKASDNGSIYAIDNYSYNDDGLLIRLDYYDGNNEYSPDNYTDYFTYGYDNNSRLILKKGYQFNEGTDDYMLSQQSYTYNDAGNITSLIDGDPTNDDYYFEDYLYDENYYLIRIDAFEVEDNIPFLSGYLEITNDENGNDVNRDFYTSLFPLDTYYCSVYTTKTFLTFVPNDEVEILQADNLANYPNPFNPETTISFQLKSNLNTHLSIYNLKGQLVKSFPTPHLKIGNNEIVWNGKDNHNREVASGIYFLKLKNDNLITSKKMILMK